MLAPQSFIVFTLAACSACFPTDDSVPSSTSLAYISFIEVSVMKTPLTAKQWLLSKQGTWPSPTALIPPRVWADRFPRAYLSQTNSPHCNFRKSDLLTQTVSDVTMEEKWLCLYFSLETVHSVMGHRIIYHNFVALWVQTVWSNIFKTVLWLLYNW